MAIMNGHTVPSHMRTVPGSINIDVTEFPSAKLPSSDINPSEVASQLVDGFNHALSKNDLNALSRNFAEAGYWRDHLALTWAFRTIRSPSLILDFLQDASSSRDGFRLKEVAVDSSSDARRPKIASLDATGQISVVQFFITLKTVIGTGSGLIKLIHEGGEWKIFTMYTRLEELEGYEEPTDARRSKGVQHGGNPGRKNWAERRQAEADFTSASPTVLVIGELHLCYATVSNTSKALDKLA